MKRIFPVVAIVLCVGLYAPKTYATDEFLEALINGRLETVQRMLQESPDLARKYFYYGGMLSTALHVVAQMDHVEIAVLLIQYGAEVNAKNGQGETPLILARSRPMVELLVVSGADLYATDEFGKTKLHQAAQYDDHSILEYLLSIGMDVDLPTSHGMTPLFMAISIENIEAADLLLAHGANIDKTTNSGLTPLHYAAGGWNEKSVAFLVEKGAQLNIQDEKGNTPLLHMLETSGIGLNRSAHKCARILIKAGANLYIVNNKGHSAACILAALPAELTLWLLFGWINVLIDPFPA